MKKFSLKKKTTGKEEKKIGSFSLKKQPKKPSETPKLEENSIFGHVQQPISENKDIAITSINEVSNSTKDEPLVIAPVINETSWEFKREELRRKRTLNNKEKSGETEQTVPKLLNKDSLNINPNLLKSTGKININSYPDPPTSESYKKVPIDQFGMAMLRGMGWTPEYEREKAKNERQYN